MSVHSMPFANFATGFEASQMDAELAQRMFGDEVCVNRASPCELTPAARAFVKKANKAMAGGRCEGFAVMSSLFFGGKLNPVDFGGSTARDLTLEENTPLQRELAYWFTTQLVPEVATKQTKPYMAREVMPVLAKVLSPTATERMRIGMVRKKGKTISGGHAVTPISYAEDPSAPGVFLLRVYDNNNPDTERVLKIDTKNNRWEFNAAENPEKESRLYFGDDSNQNPLYFAPIFNRVGQLPCSFCKEDGQTTVSSSGGAQISIAGLDLGVIDGFLKGDTAPSFSLALDNAPAEFLVTVPRGEVTVNVTNPADADFPYASQGVEVQGYRFTASAFDLLVTGDDKLTVSADGAAVGYINSSRTSLGLKTEVSLDDGRALSVSAVLTGGSSDVTAGVNRTTGAVSIAAGNSQGAQVTLVVTNTSATGEETTGQLTFMSGGDGGITADTAGWMAGDPLTGTVTNNGVTVTVSNACEDGVKSGMESDVDCGAVCTDKCNVAQGCRTAGDCLSGFCSVGGRCVATSCEDGSRTGNETAVDCGGSCSACAVGVSCTQNTDCAGTAACANNVCRPTFAVSAAVTGLPTVNSVLLHNNGGDDLSVSVNGTSLFATRVVGAYDVTVAAQPQEAQCSIASGAGTATTDVLVQITCVDTFALGGTVTGLPMGETVTLINGSDTLLVSAGGAFAFSGRVADIYSVTVQTQPASATCIVTNGSGVASANVTDVQVTCSPGGSDGGSSSGLLDTTFNTVGWLAQSRGVGSDFWVDGVLNADGSMVLVGQSDNAGTVSWVVSKVLSTGALDMSFGTGGHLSISRGSGIQYPRGIFADGSGYLVVGSLTGLTNPDVAVARVTASGALDTAFGTNGVSLYDSGGWDYVEDAAIDSMGRIVVVGRASTTGAGPHDSLVARINANGTLDVTFGNAGFVITDSGGDDTYASVAVDTASQDLILLGSVNGSTRVWRFDSASLPVFSFGTSGEATLDLSGVSGTQVPYRVVMSGTKILVAGRGDVTNSDFAFMQLTATGAIDLGFGTAGRLLIDRGGAEVAYALTPAPGGGWYFGGHSGNNLVVGKMSAAGVVDTSFATAGFFSAPLASSGLAYHLMVDSAQRIVAVGTIRLGATEDLGVARITP